MITNKGGNSNMKKDSNVEVLDAKIEALTKSITKSESTSNEDRIKELNALIDTRRKLVADSRSRFNDTWSKCVDVGKVLLPIIGQGVFTYGALAVCRGWEENGFIMPKSLQMFIPKTKIK